MFLWKSILGTEYFPVCLIYAVNFHVASISRAKRAIDRIKQTRMNDRHGRQNDYHSTSSLSNRKFFNLHWYFPLVFFKAVFSDALYEQSSLQLLPLHLRLFDIRQLLTSCWSPADPLGWAYTMSYLPSFDASPSGWSSLMYIRKEPTYGVLLFGRTMVPSEAWQVMLNPRPADSTLQ